MKILLKKDEVERILIASLRGQHDLIANPDIRYFDNLGAQLVEPFSRIELDEI